VLWVVHNEENEPGSWHGDKEKHDEVMGPLVTVAVHEVIAVTNPVLNTKQSPTM